MRAAYIELHRRGFAHSAEAWLDDELVGGLYGVTLGAAFFGESMFSLEPNASKVVFATLVPHLEVAGYRVIDCQIYTDHLAQFGAEDWPRSAFLAALADALPQQPNPRWPKTSRRPS
jgi:leucyl/phenylalanyl-tRNA--protein transferase